MTKVANLRAKSKRVKEHSECLKLLTHRCRMKNKSNPGEPGGIELKVPAKRSQPVLKPRPRTKDVRKDKAENGQRNEKSNGSGHSTAATDVKVEHIKRSNRSKGRIQLRLKKVKEYKADIDADAFSEYSVTTKKVWNSCGMGTPQSDGKERQKQKWPKANNTDLVCAYDITDTVDGHGKGGLKLLLKYQRLKDAGSAVFNHLVRPSHRLKRGKHVKNEKCVNTSRLKPPGKERFRSEECGNAFSESDITSTDSCDTNEMSEIRTLSDQNNATLNMSERDCKSEFENNEDKELCKKFSNVCSKSSRSLKKKTTKISKANSNFKGTRKSKARNGKCLNTSILKPQEKESFSSEECGNAFSESDITSTDSCDTNEMSEIRALSDQNNASLNMSESDSKSEFENKEDKELCKKISKVCSKSSKSFKKKITKTSKANLNFKGTPMSKARKKPFSQTGSDREDAKDDTGLFKCEFCAKRFYSSEVLNNHYATHISANKYMKESQTPCTNAKTPETSSVSKYKAKSWQDLRKNVQFETGTKLGKGTSPLLVNNCEIVDLLRHEDPSVKIENESKSVEREILPTEKEISQNVFEEQTSELEGEYVGLSDKSTSCCNRKLERLSVNCGTDILFCTHNTELAQACMNKVVKVAITPIRIVKEKSGDGWKRCVMSKHEQPVSSSNKLWSVAKNTEENMDKGKECRNIPKPKKAGQANKKRSLKMTLSKIVEDREEDMENGQKKQEQLCCRGTLNESAKGSGIGIKSEVCYNSKREKNTCNRTISKRAKLRDNMIETNQSLERAGDESNGTDVESCESSIENVFRIDIGAKNSLKGSVGTGKERIQSEKSIKHEDKNSSNKLNGENYKVCLVRGKRKSEYSEIGREDDTIHVDRNGTELQNSVESSGTLTYSKKRRADQSDTIRSSCKRICRLKAKSKDAQSDVEKNKHTVVCRTTTASKTEKQIDGVRKSAGQFAEEENDKHLLFKSDSGTDSIKVSESNSFCPSPTFDRSIVKLRHRKGRKDNLTCNGAVCSRGRYFESSAEENEHIKDGTLTVNPNETDWLPESDCEVYSSKMSESNSSSSSPVFNRRRLKPRKRKLKIDNVSTTGVVHETGKMSEIAECKKTQYGKVNKKLNNSIKVKKVPVSKEFVSSSSESSSEDNSTEQTIMSSVDKNLVSSENEMVLKPIDGMTRKSEVQENLVKMFSALNERNILTSSMSDFSASLESSEAFIVESGCTEGFDHMKNKNKYENKETEEKDDLKINCDISKFTSEIAGASDGGAISENEDDERIYDSCYDEILIEFASDMDIALNTPGDKSLIIDENDLYQGFENIRTKEPLPLNNVTGTTNRPTDVDKSNPSTKVPLFVNDGLETVHYAHSNDSYRNDMMCSNLKSISESEKKFATEMSKKGDLPNTADAITACMNIINQPILSGLEKKKNDCSNSFHGNSEFRNKDTIDTELYSSESVHQKNIFKNRSFGTKTNTRRKESRHGAMDSESDGTNEIKSVTTQSVLNNSIESTEQKLRDDKKTDANQNSIFHITEKVEDDWVCNVKEQIKANYDEEMTQFGKKNEGSKIKNRERLNLNKVTESDKELMSNINVSPSENARKSSRLRGRTIGEENSTENVTVHEMSLLKVSERKARAIFDGDVSDGQETCEQPCCTTSLERTKLNFTKAKFDLLQETHTPTISENCKDDNNNNLSDIIHLKEAVKEETRDVILKNKAIIPPLSGQPEMHIQNLGMNKAEVDTGTNDVLLKRFYRCGKCNKLFHAVAPLDVNTCSVCDKTPVVSKTSLRCKRPSEKIKANDEIDFDRTNNDVLLNRFYRCEKCDKLIHAVAPLDVNTCTVCDKAPLVSKTSVSCKGPLEKIETNDSRDCESGPLGKLECAETENIQVDAENDTRNKECVKSIEESDAKGSEMSSNVENSKEKTYDSHALAEQQTSLKLVLQKVKKLPTKSDMNHQENTCLPVPPQWKVRSTVCSETEMHQTQGSPFTDRDSPQSVLQSNASTSDNETENTQERIKTENINMKLKGGDEEKIAVLEGHVQQNSQLSNDSLIVDCFEGDWSEKDTSLIKGSLIKVEKIDKIELKEQKIDAANVKSDCPEELNEFEKALLKGYRIEKKEKTRRKENKKDRKIIKSKKMLEERNHLGDDKLILHKRKSRPALTSDESVQPFQMSRTAQMIYNKHQKGNLNQDELPDFSATKIDLGNLQPLSVSARSVHSVKSSWKDNDSNCKLSEEDSNSTGYNAVRRTYGHETAQSLNVPTYSNAKSASVAESKRTDVFLSNKMYGQSSVTACLSNDPLEANGYNHSATSTAWTNNLSVNDVRNRDAVTLATRSERPNAGNTKGKSVKQLKELKKELESIGFAKDAKMNDTIGSFSLVTNNFTPTFSSQWGKQKTDTMVENIQPALPSFSDTFSKIISPRSMNQTMFGFSDFAKTSEYSDSSTTLETESSFVGDHNDGDNGELNFGDLRENQLEGFGGLSEGCRMLGKRKNIMEDESYAYIPAKDFDNHSANVDEFNTSVDPNMPQFMAIKQEGNVVNFSSTPAVKCYSGNSMKDSQFSQLNISSISKSPPSQQKSSGTSEPKRRRIKRLEVPKNVEDQTAVKRDSNTVEETPMASKSILIVSAECSKIDMSKLPGPAVSTSLCSMYNTTELKESMLKGSFSADNDQTLKDEVDIGDDRQGMTEAEKDRDNVDVTMKMEECLYEDKEASTRDKTLLDYEDYDDADFLYSDDCHNAVSEDDFKEFRAVGSLDRIVENAYCYTPVKYPERMEEEKEQNDKLADKEHVGELIKISKTGTEKKFRTVGYEDILCRDPEHFGEISNSENERKLRKGETGKWDTCETGVITSLMDSDRDGEFGGIKEETKHIDSDQDDIRDIWSVVGKNTNLSTNKAEKKYNVSVELENECSKYKDSSSEYEDQFSQEPDDESQGNKTEDLMDDILDLYASDEEATFLFDSPTLDPPSQSQKEEKKSVKGKDSCKVTDMKIKTGSCVSENPAQYGQVSKESSPVLTQECNQRPSLPMLRPLRSNPIKGTWMPKGWCFRYFNRSQCNPGCMFRHDPPTEDVFQRYIGDITEKCKKGELDIAMNMLMSHQYFIKNIGQDDLDRLFGYSINNLKMEYSHRLLQIIALRDVIKQGHIDDIIFLWKRLVCSNNEVLKDALAIARQNKIFLHEQTVQILLETFTVCGDMYMLWDLINYTTQKEGVVISQQYINKAISLVACCQDTALLSTVLSWLEKSTTKQLTHIYKEVLQRLKLRLHQMNMVDQLSVVNQCLTRKIQLAGDACVGSVSKIPLLPTPQTSTYMPSYSKPTTFGHQRGSALLSASAQSRAATPSCVSSTGFGQWVTANRKSQNYNAKPVSVSTATAYQDLSEVGDPGKQNSQQRPESNFLAKGYSKSIGVSDEVLHHNIPSLLTLKCKETATLTQCHKTEGIKIDMANGCRSVVQAGPVISQPRVVTEANKGKTGFASRQSRAVTPPTRCMTDPASSSYSEMAATNRGVMEQLKEATEQENWDSLADIFVCCCQNGPPAPEVFEQVLTALIQDESCVGEAWQDFILHIKLKQLVSPGIRLNKCSLSVLGSEVFYSCYQRSSPDAKEVLLTIINTEFLSLSPSVGQRWGVCLDFLAAEFLSVVGMPETAAEVLLGMSSNSRSEADVKTRCFSFIQPLILQLCKAIKHSLAFQLFCMAFKWKYRGLQKLASEIILSCLRCTSLDIPVQIYELYLNEGRQFDVADAVKYSMLNVLLDKKPEYSKRLYREMTKSNCSSTSFYLQQSLQKPRCIWLQSSHTYKEIRLIVGEFLQDLYTVLCEQVSKKVPLTAQELSLDVAVAVDNRVFDASLFEMPFVGPAMGSLSNIKHILSKDLGIESELSRRGIVKLAVQPTSLEKYLKTLDKHGANLGLDFESDTHKSEPRKKIRITR